MLKVYWESGIVICVLIFMTIILMRKPKSFQIKDGHFRSPSKESQHPNPYMYYKSADKIAKRLLEFQSSFPRFCKYTRLKPFIDLTHHISALSIIPPKLDGNQSLQIFLIGALNPMSWSAPVILMHICDKLLNDLHISAFHSRVMWHIIPLANPLGYEFIISARAKRIAAVAVWRPTAGGLRPTVWHKNVDDIENSPSTCFGVNLDRNFPFHYSDESSRDPCSQEYGGSSALSALESLAVANFLESKTSDATKSLLIQVESNFDRKMECILYPWDFSYMHPPNKRNLILLAKHVLKTSKLNLKVLQGAYGGKSSGTLIDYAAGVLAFDYVYRIQTYHDTVPENIEIDGNEISNVTNLILNLARGWYDLMLRETEEL